MEKIKVLVVEDELIVSETIKEILVSYGYQVIGQVDNSDDALKILSSTCPDVVLMDVQIKGSTDGITLAEQVIKSYPVTIVFITAYYEKSYLDRVRNIRPSSYIVKPFKEQDIFVAIELAIAAISETKKNLNIQWFFFKSGGIFHKIPADDIHYLEADGSYTRLHLKERELVLAENLKSTLKKIHGEQFIRIHRSYVVNLSYVQKFTSHSVRIGHKDLNISLGYRESFLKSMNAR